ncbi:MAG: NAD(P)-dependent oxidoreductase, partial [Magnetovibrio sp.]|nr:NAD(P)-dependent oxidoreductase [Magnetovibrio sp.]
MKAAFLGLGVMGYPMAGHLQKSGHDVTVYNRTNAKSEAWVKAFGGHSEPTPALAAKGAEIVFCCVGNDDDLRAVVLGEEGAFAGMKAESIFVDNTTASAEVARELFAIGQKQDIHFIDAPVSGGEAGAQNGILTVMCGGDKAAFAKAEPVISSYARAVALMGPVGSGQLTKMVNQTCIAGILQGLAEAVNFSNKAGLDTGQVLDVISKGAATSWQMENRGSTMVKDEFDFGFAVDWMRKDLQIV